MHKLINLEDPQNKVLKIAIVENGKPTWKRYSLEYIAQLKKDTDEYVKKISDQHDIDINEWQETYNKQRRYYKTSPKK